MSVTTTADERLEAARENVRQAIDNLSDIVIKEVWGHDEFRPEFRAKLSETLIDLIRVRTKIG